MDWWPWPWEASSSIWIWTGHRSLSSNDLILNLTIGRLFVSHASDSILMKSTLFPFSRIRIILWAWSINQSIFGQAKYLAIISLSLSVHRVIWAPPLWSFISQPSVHEIQVLECGFVSLHGDRFRYERASLAWQNISLLILFIWYGAGLPVAGLFPPPTRQFSVCPFQVQFFWFLHAYIQIETDKDQ